MAEGTQPKPATAAGFTIIPAHDVARIALAKRMENWVHGFEWAAYEPDSGLARCMLCGAKHQHVGKIEHHEGCFVTTLFRLVAPIAAEILNDLSDRIILSRAIYDFRDLLFQLEVNERTGQRYLASKRVSFISARKSLLEFDRQFADRGEERTCGK